jgi:hypothetical protein
MINVLVDQDVSSKSAATKGDSRMGLAGSPIRNCSNCQFAKRNGGQQPCVTCSGFINWRPVRSADKLQEMKQALVMINHKISPRDMECVKVGGKLGLYFNYNELVQITQATQHDK